MSEKDYIVVPASQTDAALSAPNASGAAGDVISKLVIIPAATNAGNISIRDGDNDPISVFVTGTLADLSPIVLDLGMKSRRGAWKVTTGASVSVLAVGSFH